SMRLWRFAPSGGASAPSNGAFAPSVGLCPTPRFLLEAKRKRKAILLRKEEKRTARQITIYNLLIFFKKILQNPRVYDILTLTA
ncbi:MAG: hypothetical protein ACI4RK_05725, partial [Oscillospiraceae bacterium]